MCTWTRSPSGGFGHFLFILVVTCLSFEMDSQVLRWNRSWFLDHRVNLPRLLSTLEVLGFWLSTGTWWLQGMILPKLWNGTRPLLFEGAWICLPIPGPSCSPLQMVQLCYGSFPLLRENGWRVPWPWDPSPLGSFLMVYLGLYRIDSVAIGTSRCLSWVSWTLVTPSSSFGQLFIVVMDGECLDLNFLSTPPVGLVTRSCVGSEIGLVFISHIYRSYCLIFPSTPLRNICDWPLEGNLSCGIRLARIGSMGTYLKCCYCTGFMASR